MTTLTPYRAYKVLDERGGAIYGRGKWDLPNGGPGKWKTHKGALVPCESGLHLCRKQDLVLWLGPTIYEAEYEGEIVTSDDKIVVAKARLVRKLDTWNETTARLFACDSAARAVRMRRKEGLAIDGRVAEAITVARRFARGEATDAERQAAWSAAWSAARSAAWSAARLAARSAARSAAGSAAWSAAWLAAWLAARSAAESAERTWQTKRLFEYLEGKRA